MNVLVTGGAGFVGANVAISLAGRHPDWQFVAFDNLRRRGGELNLPRLREAGVRFLHGDVRDPGDLAECGEVDTIIECSAEPSVLAGLGTDTDYVVRTNLIGAYNCLELARRAGAQLLFLSTSRVYPVAPLNSLSYSETSTRFELTPDQPFPGVSEAGVSERFPLDSARTLYGATKLAAELLVLEYIDSFGLSAVIDRCGVIAGPWQMGKVDQGVFTHWMLSHYFGLELTYLGYRGRGKQVRDLLAVEDLVELLDEQIAEADRWAGFVGNVGGGRSCSLSLVETTDLCRQLTGNDVPVRGSDEARPGDVPIYISDCGLLYEHTEWRPRRTPSDILESIFLWINDNERAVRGALL
jgi:CDP-paratose 2-epimerase